MYDDGLAAYCEKLSVSTMNTLMVARRSVTLIEHRSAGLTK